MSDRSACIGQPAFICPHCEAYTQQKWLTVFIDNVKPDYVHAYDLEKIKVSIDKMRDEIVKTRSDPRKAELSELLGLWEPRLKILEFGDAGLSGDWHYVNVIQAWNSHFSRCFVCERLTFWIGDKIVYPRRNVDTPAPNSDLPADIIRDYEEAAEVLSVSPRSAAALLRLAIQKLCSAILDRPGNIDEMIGELVKQGLNVKIQQALDVVRVIGNEAVHPGTLDLRDDIETTGRLFSLVNLIAEAMISQPKHVQQLYDALPPNKLEGIEQRNAKALTGPKS